MNDKKKVTIQSNKILIPDESLWAWGGDKDLPTLDRFESGNQTGVGASPPKHSDHNYVMNRAAVNEQAILREGITAYSANEAYEPYAMFKTPSGDIGQTVEGGQAATTDRTFASLETIFPVGIVIFRMDATYPGDTLPGDWLLISGDASLSFGDGGQQNGLPIGDNNPGVPLLSHNHSATFAGDAVGDHEHPVVDDTGTGSLRGPSADSDGSSADGRANPAGGHTPSGQIAVGETGEDSPTLNVRGARISINVWQRVSSAPPSWQLLEDPVYPNVAHIEAASYNKLTGELAVFESSDQTIHIMDPSTETWRVLPDEDDIGLSSNTRSISFASNGNIAIADVANDRIVVWDAVLEEFTVLGGTNLPAWEFPYNVAYDSTNNLAVNDAALGDMFYYNAGLDEWTVFGGINKPDDFDNSEIAFDNNDNLGLISERDALIYYKEIDTWVNERPPQSPPTMNSIIHCLDFLPSGDMVFFDSIYASSDNDMWNFNPTEKTWALTGGENEPDWANVQALAINSQGVITAMDGSLGQIWRLMRTI